MWIARVPVIRYRQALLKQAQSVLSCDDVLSPDCHAAACMGERGSKLSDCVAEPATTLCHRTALTTMPLSPPRFPSPLPSGAVARSDRDADADDVSPALDGAPHRVADTYSLPLDDAGRPVSPLPDSDAMAPRTPGSIPWMPPRHAPAWPPNAPHATPEGARQTMRQRWLALRDHPRLHGNGEKFTRLMVVDDNLDVRYAMHECLSAEGYDVAVASDGMSALALAKMTLPEAILLDIGMPALDGYSTARAFRRIPAFMHTPIIAITGFFDTQHINDARTAGFDFYFQKPVDIDTLLALLRGDPV
jgi:CheY-like chemotaxis protein